MLGINAPAFIDGVYGVIMLRQAISDHPIAELKWSESDFPSILRQVSAISDAAKTMKLDLCVTSPDFSKY